jgi:hypothetical protein
MGGARMKKLSIGVQSFEVMRTRGFVYVDKTEGIHHLATEGMYYFLARPRRFGKSLLVSTLKCLFEARRELFEGLWIDMPGRWEWQAHPVVVLDFNGIALDTPEHLSQGLAYRLEQTAETCGVTLKSPSLVEQFGELIEALYRRSKQPVVVLIDEYDKPLVEHLGKGEAGLEIARANQDVLRAFYGVLKGSAVSPLLRFVLLTGVSRFSRVSIFSALNNLNDISMHEDYAALLGYTAAELSACFTGHIERLAAKLQCSKDETSLMLAQHYNGYRFSRSTVKVYNPFSVLAALDHRELQNYWFETGTPAFLVNLLQEKRYSSPQLEGLQVSQAAFSTFELDRLSPEALLFQTGYLTIADVKDSIYTLNYPNQEVKTAFTEALLLAIVGLEPEASSHVLRLSRHLQNENLEAFFETLKAIFASIPYDIQTRRDEGYYHTICYLALSATGGAAQSSVLTSRGRIDMVMAFPDKVYVIEFKCGQSATAALQQIREKGYAEAYRQSCRKVILLGIKFSLENRNVEEWATES